MIRFGFILAALLPASADALSCMRPDPVRAFHAAQDAPEVYRIFVGTLDFDGRRMPRTQMAPTQMRSVDPVVARFVGKGLGMEGLVDVTPRDLTLVPECSGPWCGSLQPGGPMLFFARDGAAGLEVVIDPCLSMIFADPTRDMINSLTACLRGEACDEAPLRR